MVEPPRRVLVTLSVLLGATFAGCSGASTPTGTGAGVPTTDLSVSASPSATPPTAQTAFVLDASFADKGVATVATPKAVALCSSTLGAIAVTSEAIYLAGSYPMAGDETLGGCDAGVMKVLNTGKIDTSFGKGGIARVDEAYGFLNSIAVGADGKITVAGAFLTDNDKLEPDLSVDLHFAAVGPALFAGRIAETSVLAGRLLASGAPDTTFGAKGFLRFRGHPGMLSNEIVLGADGTTTIVGSTKTPRITDEGQVDFSSAEGFALKIGANGQVDAKFGEKGAAYFDPGGAKLIGGYVSRSKDGKLVFVGEDGPQSFLARVTPEMKLDAAYGDKGFARTVRALDEETAVAYVDGKDGAVVVTTRRGGDFAIARWDGAGRPIASWGNGGLLTLSGEPDESTDVDVLRADGVLFHFVQRPGEPVLVTRIDAAGKIDPGVSALPLGDPGSHLIALASATPAGGIVVVLMDEDMQLQISRYIAK